RDFHVTGVQTCALPICSQQLDANRPIARSRSTFHGRSPGGGIHSGGTPRAEGSFRRSTSSMSRFSSSSVAENGAGPFDKRLRTRSEERRVGKEGRARRE